MGGMVMVPVCIMGGVIVVSVMLVVLVSHVGVSSWGRGRPGRPAAPDG
jgi:hypothetical protein